MAILPMQICILASFGFVILTLIMYSASDATVARAPCTMVFALHAPSNKDWVPNPGPAVYVACVTHEVTPTPCPLWVACCCEGMWGVPPCLQLS
jgi:hypothetical protein